MTLLDNEARPQYRTPGESALLSISSRAGYICDMDPREDELLTHVAAGTDIWTAQAATSKDVQPPKSGCLTVLLVAVLWAVFT